MFAGIAFHPGQRPASVLIAGHPAANLLQRQPAGRLAGSCRLGAEAIRTAGTPADVLEREKLSGNRKATFVDRFLGSEQQRRRGGRFQVDAQRVPGDFTQFPGAADPFANTPFEMTGGLMENGSEFWLKALSTDGTEAMEAGGSFVNEGN